MRLREMKRISSGERVRLREMKRISSGERVSAVERDEENQ